MPVGEPEKQEMREEGRQGRGRALPGIVTLK